MEQLATSANKLYNKSRMDFEATFEKLGLHFPPTFLGVRVEEWLSQRAVRQH